MNSLRHAATSISKKVNQVVLILLLAGLSCSAHAQQSLKIAVLDMTTALFNSEVAKQVDQSVRDETSADEQKVRALAEQATALQEQRTKDDATLSAEQKRKIEEQIEEIGVQYQFLVQKIQKIVQDRRQQFQQTYAQNLFQAITAVVEEENFDIVLRAEAAVHYGTSYDITARVTEKLNLQE